MESVMFLLLLEKRQIYFKKLTNPFKILEEFSRILHQQKKVLKLGQFANSQKKAMLHKIKKLAMTNTQKIKRKLTFIRNIF